MLRPIETFDRDGVSFILYKTSGPTMPDIFNGSDETFTRYHLAGFKDGKEFEYRFGVLGSSMDSDAFLTIFDEGVKQIIGLANGGG